MVNNRPRGSWMYICSGITAFTWLEKKATALYAVYMLYMQPIHASYMDELACIDWYVCSWRFRQKADLHILQSKKMVVGACINLLVGCILSNGTFSKYRSRLFLKMLIHFCIFCIYVMKTKETDMVLNSCSCTCSNTDGKKGLLMRLHSLK